MKHTGVIQLIGKSMVVFGLILAICVSTATADVAISTYLMFLAIAALTMLAGILLLEVVKLQEQVSAEVETREAEKSAAKKAEYDRYWAAYFRS